jgi:GxxExxY protein
MALTRASSTLSAEVEQLVETTIGGCLEVHRELGPGLNERIYSLACCFQFQDMGIKFEREKRVPVRYRGHLLCHQRVDLLVENQLVLEIKSVEKIHPLHVTQTVGYLRITGARIGLLANFNVQMLKYGIRRVIL